MKIKHLVIGLLAMAATVACKREEPLETPELNVDKATVEVAATAGEASFNVTSNQNWVATADADWVSLDPASGAASEKAVAVKVTAEDNETTAAREATVTVKAGDLTKTVKVKQVAAGETPAPDHSEWALVGSFNEWNAGSDLYLSVLDEEYFVYYGLELAANDEFKFLKGGAWPPAGTEIGGNGLVEPNTIQPAGGSNIKVTEAGKYDIYLAADLATFYVMSEGKLPSEAVEPAPVENQWSMMGCFVDNQWNTDVPMTKEGEWIVAKGAQFTELTFKIRANQSWSDATNIGRAPGSERAVVNGRIEVVTAEYAKANLGGDAADIKLNGEPGTYDVYFSFENLEVYVMEAGFKPGEKEPQNPDPVEITYTVVGTIADAAWVNNVAAGLMAKEGDLYVAKNVPFVWNSTCYGGDYNIIEFKIVETGTWDGFAYPEKNVNQYANAEITVQIGGENIAVNAPEGNYDVYFDKANLKVWVMEAGFKPGEKEPLIPEEVEPVTEGVIWENDGTVGAATWAASPYRFAKEGKDGLGECCAEIPAAVWEGMKIAPFCVNVKPAPEATWWQIRVLDGYWTINDESGASDINVNTEGLVNNGDGTYTFQVDLASNPDLVALIDAQHLLFAGDGFIINKIYFGDLPTPGAPELQKSEWALVGSFNDWKPTSDIYLSVLDENYFVYYGFDMPAGAEFKFLKGGAWPPAGKEVGGNGLVQPNTIQPAGGSNIKVNEAGKYDIYLTADLSKFYVMSEGKLPSEATEPAPVEKTWGMMGCFVDNQWSKDVPMTKEGEWLVAKGAQFTELTFKIRANESWADATNIGVAPGSAKGEINTKVAVVTAEYAKANLGGDAADIKLNGEAGTYDVYFSYDKLELYVMTPGLKPGEQPEPEYTLDGKQWLLQAMNTYVLVDLGLYEEDAMVIALPAMDGSGFACYMYGTYEIEKTDAKSGNIIFTQYDVEFDEFMDPVAYPYSELSESVVYVSMENVLGDATPLPFVAVEEPYEIMFDNLGGGDGPSGAIENGEYWFFNGEKVMAPLAEGVTTGTLPAGNVISGASTEKNIFTLTYDPDWSYYTIQDSYGRYLGQTDETGNITVTDVLPTDDTYAFYLWAVETGYGEACSIYNAAYYYDITYSAADNNWVLVDGGYETPSILPTLVKAENPVEEPVEPSFEAGQYFIMDGKGKMVSPIAEGSTYGYWNVTPAVEDGDAYIGYAENVFTIAEVDGGYTIQDVYGRHHYMTTYNSFSVSKNTQSDNSHVWTIDLQNDGSYAIVNAKTGKTVQFSSYGNYAPYTDVTGALPYLVKADKVAEKPSAPEEEVAQFATNVKCTTVSSAYTDGVATVNGVADVFTLKLGTSKLNGKATVTIPAGSTEVTYYAVGWKGTSAKLQFSVGGSVVSSQSIAANTGATGNSPYTMTVADSDHYTVSFGAPLEADTEVTVETTGSAYRAILFGIQAK